MATKKVDPTAYVEVGGVPTTPGAYTPIANTVGEYKPVANTVAAYVPGTYTSKYQDQLDNALNTITNWSYNPLQDASYQALAKVYGARGNLAAKNSLADAAALNGGYGTSYAVSAAQQARNQYNQELASYIPELENTAYNRASGRLSALREAENTDYGRFRDTEADRQWKYTQDYQAYRDREADNQWLYNTKYNAYRDAVADSQWAYNTNWQRYQDALSQYQWARNFNLDLYGLQKSGSGGGGGGGGRRRSGGGGGGSSYSSGSGGADLSGAWDAAQSAIKNMFSGGSSKGSFASGVIKGSSNTASSAVNKLKKK